LRLFGIEIYNLFTDDLEVVRAVAEALEPLLDSHSIVAENEPIIFESQIKMPACSLDTGSSKTCSALV